MFRFTKNLTNFLSWFNPFGWASSIPKTGHVRRHSTRHSGKPIRFVPSLFNSRRPVMSSSSKRFRSSKGFRSSKRHPSSNGKYTGCKILRSGKWETIDVIGINSKTWVGHAIEFPIAIYGLGVCKKEYQQHSRISPHDLDKEMVRHLRKDWQADMSIKACQSLTDIRCGSLQNFYQSVKSGTIMICVQWEKIGISKAIPIDLKVIDLRGTSKILFGNVSLNDITKLHDLVSAIGHCNDATNPNWLRSFTAAKEYAEYLNKKTEYIRYDLGKHREKATSLQCSIKLKRFIEAYPEKVVKSLLKLHQLPQLLQRY